MFNSYHHTSPTQFVIRETHEHRAPTDQSVALLKEMEKEAAEKVLSVHRLKSNALDVVWQLMEDHRSFELTGRCRLILNGKEITFDVPLERDLPNAHYARNVVKKVAERIALEITTKLLIDTGYQTLLIRGQRGLRSGVKVKQTDAASL